MNTSRTHNAIRNISVAVSGQFLNTILSFVCRTIFIYSLGKAYLGVSGLFSNILSVMSLAELGIGEAIVYKMYKPMAEQDHERIKSYMQFYKKAYWLIGTFIFVVGLIIIPFLKYFIKEADAIDDLTIIYLLYLFNTASSYFFSYKKIIIDTDQKGYINTINRYVFLALQTMLQIIVLLLYKNFILYLSIQIVMNFLANLSIACKATKMYPYLSGKAKRLEKQDLREIFKQTSALVAHKVGGVCVSGTDNLLLSAFIGVTWVGVYSNYVTLLSIPQTFLAYIFSPLTASIGNLVSTATKEHIKETFNKLLFLNFWLYGFSSICLFVLLNPFIGKVWVGESFVLTNAIVFFIVLNFYLTGMRQVVSAFKSTSGLFWNDRFRPIAEAVVNLCASVLLLRYLGFVGVVIGTTISMITTTIWVEATVVYKHVLGEKAYKFFAKYIQYFASLLFVGVVTYIICDYITVRGLGTFIIKAVVCVVISNAGFALLYFRTKEFKELVNSYIIKYLNRLRGKQ